MDTYRGNLADHGGHDSYDSADDETGREPPPLAIGQDERRMQVRAYNYWASLLDGHHYPSVASLYPQNLPDFGPYSVLLDFTKGVENPAIPFLGAKLAAECAADGTIRELGDVPPRSLLSRITDHYMQILANQAPIGFEAEFVNQAGKTVLYRGILLPFSSNHDEIDFIYGVINWKELADQQTTDELLLEIDQALETRALDKMPVDLGADLGQWADGPIDLPAANLPADDILDLVTPLDQPASETAWPKPLFGTDAGAYADFDLSAALPEVFESPEALGSDVIEPDVPGSEVLDLGPADEAADEYMELADWLASARELALAAQGSEDRTRSAL
ncbi:MAG: PAS domain-containing protein [Novosphingobium sp.]